MKKLFVAFLILVLVFALLGAGIMTFISYVWGGYRLTPEAAVEAVSLTASEKEYIDADGFRFYYDIEDGREGYISDVYIVKRGELGTWYAVTDPSDSYAVANKDTGAYVGRLVTVARDGTYHNFYLPPFDRDEGELPDFVNTDYSSVKVGGEEYEMLLHSYFVTDK